MGQRYQRFKIKRFLPSSSTVPQLVNPPESLLEVSGYVIFGLLIPHLYPDRYDWYPMGEHMQS